MEGAAPPPRPTRRASYSSCSIKVGRTNKYQNETIHRANMCVFINRFIPCRGRKAGAANIFLKNVVFISAKTTSRITFCNERIRRSFPPPLSVVTIGEQGKQQSTNIRQPDFPPIPPLHLAATASRVFLRAIARAKRKHWVRPIAQEQGAVKEIIQQFRSFWV